LKIIADLISFYQIRGTKYAYYILIAEWYNIWRNCSTF
jgi:hypothetical protein